MDIYPVANTYSALGKYDRAQNIKDDMRRHGIKGNPGRTTVSINGKQKTYGPNDPNIEDSVIKQLGEFSQKLKEAGHVPDVSFVLQNVDQQMKEELLCKHSEKLALADAIAHTADGETIIMYKDLRMLLSECSKTAGMCGDCHATTKALAKIYGREISVR